MNILGIHSSHDSGASIIQDGRIIAAVNEERLLRKKLYWGPPLKSIEKVFEISGMEPGDIDHIAIAGITPGGGPHTDFRDTPFKKRVMEYISFTGIPSTHLFTGLYKRLYSRARHEREVSDLLQRLGVDAPVKFVPHHEAHAASAFYTSQFGKDTLVVTTDSSGDGICSIVCTSEDYELTKRSETPFFHSPGAFYGYVTYNLGFKPGRHEGKITGLAAYGNPDKTYGIFKGLMGVNKGKLEYVSKMGTWGRPATEKLHAMLQGCRWDDIAAGVQKRIEEVCTELVEAAVKRYDCDKVALAGGVFANVKINQRIGEIPQVKKVYIHPHMGDGGLGVGAGLALWADLMLDQGKKPKPNAIDNVYFGPEYSDDEIQETVKKAGLKMKEPGNIEQEIAEMLKKKKVVGRFNGRMEYGPRALGNRSILADPTDKTINDWLNKRLERTEFMPFAPSLMRESVNQFYNDFDVGEIAAQFMTITFDVTGKGVERAQAVSHVDGTARPQTVTKKQNESYYKILKAYKEVTGLPIFVNTSFNMHEQPIVCSPQDAVNAFKSGSVDVLAIGNFIVTS
jgi:carbamoyltransferase